MYATYAQLINIIQLTLLHLFWVFDYFLILEGDTNFKIFKNI